MKIIGRRFYIYAAKAKARPPIWSDDLQVGHPPAWMIELARQVKLIPPDAELPTGVIERVEEINDEVGMMNDEGRSSIHRSAFILPRYRWHLVDVQRAKRLRKPKGQAQPVWFRPF